MVDLSYYHNWYHKAPYIHKSIGILILFVTIFRIIWRMVNVTPTTLKTHTKIERVLALLVHTLLYVLLLTVLFSGYLIPTATGQAISVFGWFELPAISITPQQDLSGKIHLYTAITLMTLVTLHSLAALKHHFIDKDKTLKRMITPTSPLPKE